VNAIGAQFEKRLKRLSATLPVKTYDYVKATAGRSKDPIQTPLLSM
jgi:hypothetical protein